MPSCLHRLISPSYSTFQSKLVDTVGSQCTIIVGRDRQWCLHLEFHYRRGDTCKFQCAIVSDLVHVPRKCRFFLSFQYSEKTFRPQVLDDKAVRQIKEIQLFTDSHDQGTVDFQDQDSWSWFDIVVLGSPSATEPKVKNGLSLVWRSHANVLGNSRYNVRHTDKSFEQNHPLLQSLEVRHLHVLAALSR